MLQDKVSYCKNLINFLAENELSVCILFITRNKENDSYNVFKGNLSDEVGQTLKELCFKLSNKSYKKPEKKVFEKYDPSKKGNKHTEFLDGVDLKDIKPILDLFESEIIDLKRIDKSFLENLWFYVIRLESQNNKVLFFKKYSKGMVLTKSFPLAMSFKGGDFDKLKHDIFMIANKIDCIYFGDKLIIRCKGNFEKIFNFFKRIKSNALSAMKIIEDLPFKIDNINQFKETCLNREMMIRKLNNIYSRDTIGKIKPDGIESLIKKGIIKNISFSRDQDGKFILSSPDPWKILNILDDDYVKSLLTDIPYEASEKKEIKQN